MIHPIPDQVHDALPWVYSPSAREAADPEYLIAHVRQELPAFQAQLRQHGALLFRGFSFGTAESFQAFARVFTPELLRYIGGASPRKAVLGEVYNSTEASPRVEIAQHHEAAYLRNMPALIHFCCLQPATKNGATPLARARRVTARLPADIRETFLQKKVRYLNRMNGGLGFGRSWQSQLETPDRSVAEDRLREGGFEFEWLPNGGLRTALTCDALRPHPVTGELLWIGQPDHWHPTGLDPAYRLELSRRLPESEFPMGVTYGDGSPISEATVNTIRELVRSERVTFPWATGDVLVCDNYLISHGRQSFEGSRRVLVALG